MRLKHFVAILLMFGMLAQTLSRSFIWASYYAYKSAYARNCENKAKPMLNCNGKCKVIRKLKQEEKKDEQNPERKSENKNEPIISSKYFCSLGTHEQSRFKVYFGEFYSGNETKMPRFVFHPPTVAS